LAQQEESLQFRKNDYKADYCKKNYYDLSVSNLSFGWNGMLFWERL